MYRYKLYGGNMKVYFRKLKNEIGERDYFTFAVFSGIFSSLTITFILMGYQLEINFR